MWWSMLLIAVQAATARGRWGIVTATEGRTGGIRARMSRADRSSGGCPAVTGSWTTGVPAITGSGTRIINPNAEAISLSAGRSESSDFPLARSLLLRGRAFSCLRVAPGTMRNARQDRMVQRQGGCCFNLIPVRAQDRGFPGHGMAIARMFLHEIETQTRPSRLRPGQDRMDLPLAHRCSRSPAPHLLSAAGLHVKRRADFGPPEIISSPSCRRVAASPLRRTGTGA
jgi:hypothetical protein